MAKSVFAGPGEMTARVTAFDWSRTPLGPLSHWPPSLATTVRLMLNSRYPMFLWWGKELTNLYNDGYIAVLGARHPDALGKSGREIWSDIWGVVGPQAETVLREGRATWNESVLLLMERYRFTEETYFTFSYSPATDDNGRIAGVFCACTEDTRRVLGERRLKTLRDLGERGLTEAKSVEQACHAAAITLGENRYDVPFALLYLFDADRSAAHLIESIGVDAGSGAAPPSIVPGSAGDVWNFAGAIAADGAIEHEALEARFGRLTAGPWTDDFTRRAYVHALTRPGAPDSPSGFLVTGLSPRLAFDDEYRSFIDLAAAQIATAIGNANAYEEERLRAAKLAELDRAKTAFFSNVSHEFRTPLTLMLGPLEEVLGGGSIGSAERERLDAVHRNSLRLLRLVNALLDFSRIEAGRIDARYEPVDLAEMTCELASVFRSAMESAGLELAVECPPLQHQAYVDPAMWEKIVFNLLSNAFKFTLEGRVDVSLHERDAVFELTVRDTGTGIPSAELPHVFERFRRAPSTRGRTFEGTGIGLSLVQELVKLHGGTVGVESEVDRGSTFTVSIPAGKGHLPAERVAETSSQERSARRADAWLAEAARWSGAAAAPAPGRADERAGGARVLVADDNADMRDYIRRLLTDNGYDVTTVTDGIEAEEAIRRQHPDLILADVMMPRLDGLTLVRRLREDPLTSMLPVVLLSARAGEEARIEGLEAGADDYLVKPFGGKELLARVASRIEIARLRHEAGEILRESEQRFREMADAAPVMTWVADPSGHCTFLSRSWYEFTGQTPATGLGMGWIDAVHPGDRERSAAIFRAAVEQQEPFSLDYRLRRADGEYRWAIDSALPRRTAAGEYHGHIGSVIDITDRKLAEEALRTSADALREADRLKDDFLATLSHELRTPLTSILGWSQLLLQLRGEDEELRIGIEAIARSARVQAELVEDVLDISRITTGRMRLDRRQAPLAPVVEAALITIRPAAQAKQIELRAELDPALGSLFIDPDRVQQVVWNILSNALKFTPAGGRIDVRAFRNGQSAIIEVADTGPGIPAAFLPHIFERFRQVDNSSRRSHSGLGLGLALTKSLVELHGGSITAESEEGKGATFRVALPL